MPILRAKPMMVVSTQQCQERSVRPGAPPLPTHTATQTFGRNPTTAETQVATAKDFGAIPQIQIKSGSCVQTSPADKTWTSNWQNLQQQIWTMTW